MKYIILLLLTISLVHPQIAKGDCYSPVCNHTIQKKIEIYRYCDIILDTNGLEGDYSDCGELNERLYTKRHIFLRVDGELVNYIEGKNEYFLSDFNSVESNTYTLEKLSDFKNTVSDFNINLDFALPDTSTITFEMIFENYIKALDFERSMRSQDWPNVDPDFSLLFNHDMIVIGSIDPYSINKYKIIDNRIIFNENINFKIKAFDILGGNIDFIKGINYIELDSYTHGTVFITVETKWNTYLIKTILI